MYLSYIVVSAHTLRKFTEFNLEKWESPKYLECRLHNLFTKNLQNVAKNKKNGNKSENSNFAK